MKTVVRLPFPPAANNLFFNTKYGRAPTQKYESWKQEANNDLLRQRPRKISGPVNMLYEFKRIDKRKRDLSNLVKAPEDILVKAGIIDGDDWDVVYDIRVKMNDEVEGCRVTIESIFGAGNGTTGGI